MSSLNNNIVRDELSQYRRGVQQQQEQPNDDFPDQNTAPCIATPFPFKSDKLVNLMTLMTIFLFIIVVRELVKSVMPTTFDISTMIKPICSCTCTCETCNCSCMFTFNTTSSHMNNNNHTID